MKILLYQKGEKMMRKSGIGRAMSHQKQALEKAGVDFTTNVKEDYDLVHINTVDPQARNFAKKAKRKGKKVVYHAHSTEEDFRNSFFLSNQLSPLFKKLIISSYNLGDFILTPTPYSKRILEGYGMDKPIQAVSNGIDLDRFKYNYAKVLMFRNFFSIGKDEDVVISVGLYFERKGLPDFIDIARLFPDIKFIWFGYSNLMSVTAKIRESIKNKPSNVILPGYIDGDIIEGAFASASIFFFPSYEETEGIVILEALAASCQVLVRDIEAYDPWLVDKVNCYKGNSNGEFVSIITALLDGNLKSTTEKGYELAQSKSIEAIGQELKSVYEKVMEETE